MIFWCCLFKASSSLAFLSTSCVPPIQSGLQACQRLLSLLQLGFSLLQGLAIALALSLRLYHFALQRAF